MNVVILITTIAGAVLSGFVAAVAVAAGAWGAVAILVANCAIDVMIAVDTYGEMREETS